MPWCCHIDLVHVFVEKARNKISVIQNGKHEPTDLGVKMIAYPPGFREKLASLLFYLLFFKVVAR